MSKTQSDTGREEGLYVNKKVEKKRGQQMGAGRDRGTAHVCTHAPQQVPNPSQGTWEGACKICSMDRWMCGGGWVDGWIK